MDINGRNEYCKITVKGGGDGGGGGGGGEGRGRNRQEKWRRQ